MELTDKEIVLISGLVNKALMNWMLSKPHGDPQTIRELKLSLLIHPLTEKEASTLHDKLLNWKNKEVDDGISQDK